MLNVHRVDMYFHSPCGIVFVIFCSCCIFMRLYKKKKKKKRQSSVLEVKATKRSNAKRGWERTFRKRKIMAGRIEAAGCSSLVLAPDHRLRAKICVRSKSKQSHGRLAKLPKQEISKDSPKKLREMPQLLLPKWFNISRKQRFLQVCIITKLVLSTRSNLVEQKFKMQRTWRTR